MQKESNAGREQGEQADGQISAMQSAHGVQAATDAAPPVTLQQDPSGPCASILGTKVPAVTTSAPNQQWGVMPGPLSAVQDAQPSEKFAEQFGSEPTQLDFWTQPLDVMVNMPAVNPELPGRQPPSAASGRAIAPEGMVPGFASAGPTAGAHSSINAIGADLHDTSLWRSGLQQLREAAEGAQNGAAAAARAGAYAPFAPELSRQTTQQLKRSSTHLPANAPTWTTAGLPQGLPHACESYPEDGPPAPANRGISAVSQRPDAGGRALQGAGSPFPGFSHHAAPLVSGMRALQPSRDGARDSSHAPADVPQRAAAPAGRTHQGGTPLGSAALQGALPEHLPLLFKFFKCHNAT